MSIEIDQDVLLAALGVWSYEDQYGMAYEEFGECITAINQFKRGRITDQEFASEIADALIMASQLALMVGEGIVQEEVLFKLNRLSGRILKAQELQSSVG
jgi:NTP pyrophosphatase (non-canonical NTP hydrolase)